ncbi:hypothetical protein MVEN_00175300 [Mycena venus]|uniref:F-box domain-containing protein n=1 Tax=Mycena venus TaxID=2733690 RepID=A0A8H6Z183_9AGAR|nr:hypothetical protein MVEN_00175300 [Mycena venus]
MHRTLTIPDIVQLIFAEFRTTGSIPDDIHPPDLAALASLARTCTMFRDPALDLLWKYQDTTQNLIGCFPADLISETQHEQLIVANQESDAESDPSDAEDVEAEMGDIMSRNFNPFKFSVKTLHLLRPITNEDWTRPLLYSHRVKTLNLLRVGGLGAASAPVFFQICSSVPEEHVFPNLEECQISPTPIAQCIQFLISPRIRRIALYFTSVQGLDIVPTLAERCPLLTQATILVSNVSAVDSVSAFVRNLVRIKDLHVQNLDERAFEHLRHLPTLTALHLEDPVVPAEALVPIDQITSSSHSYSSLRFLHFGSTTVERVTAFINTIVNCPLEQLYIEDPDESVSTTADASRRLYSSLAARCTPSSLQEIKVGPGFRADTDLIADPVTGPTLRHLFCFQNLRAVYIDQPFGFDLTDVDIIDLASSWPRLELLSLSGTAHVPSRVTLHGLSVFARYCPALRCLQMSFDASIIPASNPSESRPTQTTLARIGVAHSAIRAPAAVAGFISKIFPNASVATWLDVEVEAEHMEYHIRWSEVNRLLWEFSRGRRFVMTFVCVIIITLCAE